jgi:nucleolar protein TMA23
MDDSSTTDTSISPSGASTPPTSASDSEAPATAVNMSDKKNKRKREDESALKEAKKAKQAKKSDTKDNKNGKPTTAPSTKDQAKATRKIAKLSPKKKASYEKRAAEKKQSLNDYILRRIQKKSEKRANRYDNTAPPTPFFTDLSGDATITTNVTTITPSKPALGLVKQSQLDAESPETTSRVAPPKLPNLPTIALRGKASRKNDKKAAPTTPKRLHGSDVGREMEESGQGGEEGEVHGQGWQG